MTQIKKLLDRDDTTTRKRLKGFMKAIVLTTHARQRLRERGGTEELVEQAIRLGEREPAPRGLWLYRLNVEYRREWDGRFYAVQQIAPVVAEEDNRFVVVTVYVFYFQEGGPA